MKDRFCRAQRAWFSDRLDGEKLPFWRGLGMPATVVFSLPDHHLLQQLQPSWPA